MDYSIKGILMMLQDLQRISFGKVTFFVETFVIEDSEPILTGCVFSGDGEPHSVYFNSDMTDDERKSRYLKLKNIIDETIKIIGNGQKR